MSVGVLGIDTRSESWAVVAMQAVEAAGGRGELLRVGDADASDAGITLVGAMPSDMRVVLAESGVPFALIGAAFASASGQAARKIVDIAADGTASLPLFGVADMLIFTPATIAAALGLDPVPEDVEALLAVQKRMVRPNQAAVVRLPGQGAAALWADRTMFVAAAAADETAGAAARFSATIAAAVAQGIGPEPALEMALAAAESR